MAIDDAPIRNTLSHSGSNNNNNNNVASGVIKQPTNTNVRHHSSDVLTSLRHHDPYLWELSPSTAIKDRDDEDVVVAWRPSRLGRSRTSDVVLMLCLNIGTDPPDVIKCTPHAQQECWIDPEVDLEDKSREKVNDFIARALHAQYTCWHKRARYNRLLDPTTEATQRRASVVRREAGKDRILWHYNGHGVPKPTANGEIWVFNDNFTQYIPLAISELRSWVGDPAIYVLDCSNAAVLFPFFESSEENDDDDSSTSSSNNCPLVLAAVDVHEILPMNPNYPADIFTSCLTTPITIALQWFIRRNPVSMGHIPVTFVRQIPGKLNDRKSPLGELNWIFTAITDTIAWEMLPKELFEKLFRQDLLVACLFRNFLLAQRIMAFENCHPKTLPALPDTHRHHLWEAWDVVVEEFLFTHYCNHNNNSSHSKPVVPHHLISEPAFFAQQLTAFEVYLQSGDDSHDPPHQLTMVLQVLLSHRYRERALNLLRRFLDLGPWAVGLALKVGIFPYVVKLLQSPVSDFRQHLVYIWPRIIAYDKSCQVDLIKDRGYQYFIKYLSVTPSSSSSSSLQTITSEQRLMAAFVLSVVCEDFALGRKACVRERLPFLCIELLSKASVNATTAAAKEEGDDDDDDNPFLRRWLCFCLANSWQDYDEVKLAVIKAGIPNRVLTVAVDDPSAEVRAAAAYAIGNVFGTNPLIVAALNSEDNDGLQFDVAIGAKMLTQCSVDASPLVRREALFAIAHLVFHPFHLPIFLEIAQNYNTAANSLSPEKSGHVHIWHSIKQIQSSDTFPAVSQTASSIVAEINTLVLSQKSSPLSTAEKSMAASDASEGDGAETAVVLQRDASMPNLSNASNVTIESSSPQIMTGGSGSVHVSQSYGNLNGMQNPTGGHIHQFPVAERENVVYVIALPQKLVSRLYSWSKWWFSEPLFHAEDINEIYDTKVDDPLSDFGATRLCRERRNRHVRVEAEKLKANATDARQGIYSTEPELFGAGYKTKLRQDVCLDNDAEMTSLLLFHPFESTLVVADEKDGIHLWDYRAAEKKLSFANRNTTGARLTSFAWLNEEQQSLLLCGSDDGNIKIWQGLLQKSSVLPKLLTSFQAVPDLIPGTRGSGLVASWQQFSSNLIAGGHSPYLRIYDMETEQCVNAARTDVACLTSIHTESLVENSFWGTCVAGCSDGSVCLFDSRTSLKVASVFKEHEAWVVNAHIRSGTYEMMSGSVSGDVKVWDVRQAKAGSIRTIEAHRDSPMTALAFHEYIPIFATGSHNQFIKLCNRNGEKLEIIRYHLGFLGNRIGPVSCLQFHPYKALLAAGATDSLVAVYSSSES